MENIIEALKRRYATQGYDSSKKVSEENLNTILEAMRLAPSSFGIQPWKFVVVNNPELREKIKEQARDAAKITDASHLIVIASKKNLTEADIDEYMNAIVTTRNIPAEALAGFKGMIMGTVGSRDEAGVQMWNAKQSYIALGFGLAAAATLGIDAGPMEGFHADNVNQILGLTDYTATTMMTVGYRSAEDQTQHYAKVRFPMDKVVEVK